MSMSYSNKFANEDKLETYVIKRIFDVPLLSTTLFCDKILDMTANIDDFLARHFGTLEKNKDFFEVLPLLLKYEELVFEYRRLTSEVVSREYQLKNFPAFPSCWTKKE